MLSGAPKIHNPAASLIPPSHLKLSISKIVSFDLHQPRPLSLFPFRLDVATICLPQWEDQKSQKYQWLSGFSATQKIVTIQTIRSCLDQGDSLLIVDQSILTPLSPLHSPSELWYANPIMSFPAYSPSVAPLLPESRPKSSSFLRGKSDIQPSILIWIYQLLRYWKSSVFLANSHRKEGSQPR